MHQIRGVKKSKSPPEKLVFEWARASTFVPHTIKWHRNIGMCMKEAQNSKLNFRKSLKDLTTPRIREVLNSEKDKVTNPTKKISQPPFSHTSRLTSTTTSQPSLSPTPLHHQPATIFTTHATHRRRVEDAGEGSTTIGDSSTSPSVRVAHRRTTPSSPGTAAVTLVISLRVSSQWHEVGGAAKEENQSRKRKTTKKATTNRKKPPLPPKAKPSGSGSGKSNRKSSHVWKHFEKLPKVNPKDPNEAPKCMCIYCGNEFNCATSNGTSHLNNHFRKTCKQSPFRNDEDKQKAYGGYEQLQQPSSVPASQGEEEITNSTPTNTAATTSSATATSSMQSTNFT
ncbi:hypothetical protein F8388_012675 [Cannabis sativa]|uniref:BED-type domain-containing protein n=1 Tax=Cannabis sativa TaxID=3483 RepID=A0A7J6HCJ9_CANSA|nr:hypothetical protein F8388_012675 [Cannabis sativa]